MAKPRLTFGTARRYRWALSALFVVALAFFGASPLFAQSDRSQSLLFPGNAVVTGFSGATSVYKEDELPENSTLADETFIDLNGSPVRIFDLEASGADDALLPNSPQTYEFSARDVGQVFGLALDDRKLPDGNAPAPDIYVTATSAYGLHLVAPDADGDGLPERVKRGGPGVKWMDGQFGLEKAGGPGSIWKIDGVSGDVSLFADLMTDGVANSGPGLGNIVFDATHRQFFATDRDTGLIHRLDMSGQDLGTFDHGVDGRAVQNLAPVPFDPANRADIGSDKFHSDDPATWGYAALQRRLWGLALHQGRLYYAVADGPQIWSVAIKNDGGFGAPRWELDLPAEIEPYEISDIEFTGRGRMVLAQRGQVTGAYDYLSPIKSEDARVLRYRLERPDDPTTPSRWSSEPEEYAVGQTGDYRNTDGGLAIGYGYTRQGTFNYRACRATLWATGDGLRQITRRTIAPRQAAARDETQFLNGLQGNAVTLVRPENAPPKLARFVDFSGAYSAERTRGWIGDIAIPVLCQPQDPYVPPPALPPLPPAQNVLDLAIDKQQIGACTIGGICRFRISVRNVNSAAYRGPLLIRDEISQAGMALVGYGALPWTCGQVGKEVSCKRPEVLLWPGRQVNLWVDFQLKAKILIPGWRNCAAITWAGNRNSEPTVRAVQMELSDLGFYAGPVDGALTPATRTAIGDFQVAAGLPATGEVTPEVLELLFGPGAHRLGDANPLNDRDCADIAFIAGPLPGPGPDPLPEIAALDVSIGGQAECPFGQECSLGLTIRNTLAVPFDQTVDGVVDLKRLGVDVPEQIAQTPGFCAGPIAQMDIDCRFRLQLAPNQARSYPLRLTIQSPLLDPADAANRAPDGVVRARACFAVEDLSWLGWIFGREFDRDCHSFVVPEGVVAAPGGEAPEEAAPEVPEPEDDDWIASGDVEFAKKGPASCTYMSECTFNVTFRNRSAQRIQGVDLWDYAARASGPNGTFSPYALPITSIEPQLCDPELNVTFAAGAAAGDGSRCIAELNLDAGASQTYAITLRIDNPKYDPRIAENRGEQDKVWLRNCFTVPQGNQAKSSCVHVAIAEPTDDIADQPVLPAPQPIPPEAPVQEQVEQPQDEAPDGPRDPIAGRFGPQLSVSKVAGSRRCEGGKECSFAITVANNGVVPYQGPLVISEQMTPQNARLLRTTPSPWNCKGSNGRFTCRHPNLSLGIGETKKVRLTFRMPARAGADIRNCANFVWRGPTFNGRTAAAKQALRAHGFKPGAPNATITSQTQRAIRRFQRQQNMRITGTINPAVMNALIRSWGVGDQNAADDSSCVTAAFIRAPQTSDPVPTDPGPVVTPRPCPRGQQRVNGRCVPICGGGQSLVRGKCVCPSGQVFDRKLNRCRVRCASGTVFDGKQCVTRCPEAERWNGKQCVNRCAAGQLWSSRRNRCVNRCQSSQRWDGKQCVNRCSAGQRWTGRQCVSSCTGGKVFDAKRNRCVCPSGQTEVRGRCLRLQTAPGGQTTSPGTSTTQPIRCSGGKVYDAKRRSCVCPAGRVEIRGNCVFVQIQPNGGPSMTINPNLVKPR